MLRRHGGHVGDVHSLVCCGGFYASTAPCVGSGHGGACGGRTGDASGIGNFMLRLACLLLLVFAASSCGETPVATVMWNFPRPYPEPGLPAGVRSVQSAGAGLGAVRGRAGAGGVDADGRAGCGDRDDGEPAGGAGERGERELGGDERAVRGVWAERGGVLHGTTTVFCDDGVKSAVALPARCRRTAST